MSEVMARRVVHPRRFVLTVLASGLLVAAGGAAAAGLGAPPGSMPRVHPVSGGLPRARAGLDGPVAKVLQDAPATGAVRVSTLRNVGGRPQVRVTVAADRAAAERAVQAARADDQVRVVAVDHAVRALDVAAGPDPLRSYQWGLTRLHAEQV